METGKLHFSSPFQLNDFYEGWGTTEWHNNNLPFNARSGIWISSLSRTWNNIVMWSHYAESNEGVCIGFNEDNLKFCIEEEWKCLSICDVRYKFFVPCLSQVQSSDDRELKDFWSTKGKSWKYEKESRILLSILDFKKRNVPCDWIDDDCKSCCCKSNQNEFDIFDGPYNGGLNIDFCKNSLEEIIFGLKAENSKVDGIKKIISNNESNSCNYKKVKFSQIRALSGVYQFDKKKV